MEKTKERTLGEQKAYADGYMDCWTHVLHNLKDLETRETRAISTMLESLEEEKDESENLSRNI